MGNCLAKSRACTSNEHESFKPSGRHEGEEEINNRKMDGETVIRSVKLVVTKEEAAHLLSLISNGVGVDEMISVLETVLRRGFQSEGGGRGGREGYWTPALESIPEV